MGRRIVSSGHDSTSLGIEEVGPRWIRPIAQLLALRFVVTFQSHGQLTWRKQGLAVRELHLVWIELETARGPNHRKWFGSPHWTISAGHRRTQAVRPILFSSNRHPLAGVVDCVSRRHHQVSGQQRPRSRRSTAVDTPSQVGRPTNGSPRFRRRTVAMCVANAPAVSTTPSATKPIPNPRREACRRRVTLSPSDFPQKQPESRHHETETHKSEAGSYHARKVRSAAKNTRGSDSGGALIDPLLRC